jgi:hypothetical protein
MKKTQTGQKRINFDEKMMKKTQTGQKWMNFDGIHTSNQVF